MLAVAVAEVGRCTGRALSGRRPVRKDATAAALPAAFSVLRRRSNAAWSAWLGVGSVVQVEVKMELQVEVKVGAGLVTKAEAGAGA